MRIGAILKAIFTVTAVTQLCHGAWRCSRSTIGPGLRRRLRVWAAPITYWFTDLAQDGAFLSRRLLMCVHVSAQHLINPRLVPRPGLLKES